MKILLFGATGYLGKQIYNDLGLNFCVEGVSRSDRRHLMGDLRDEDSVKRLVGNCFYDVVIWCVMDKDKKDDLVMVSKGLRTLVDALDHRTKLIYLSSDSVFLEGTGSYQCDYMPNVQAAETSGNDYVISKVLGEYLVREVDHSSIVRVGPIYGRNIFGDIDRRTLEFLRLGDHGIYGAYTNVFKTFSNVKDISMFVTRIVTKNLVGTFHVGDKNKQSFYEFFCHQAELFGIDKKKVTAVEDTRYSGRTFDSSMVVDVLVGA